jgi:cell wall-associated NlpC family hydrolase
MAHEAARAAVVAEARSWIGTRYHHMGMIKIQRDAAGKVTERGGVDCATLLVQVYANAGITAPLAPDYYPPDWHMNRRAERYLGQMLRNTREITRDDVLPGDIVLFRWGQVFSHGAIIEAWPNVIHAYSESGLVQPERADSGRFGVLEQRFFSPWDGP